MISEETFRIEDEGVQQHTDQQPDNEEAASEAKKLYHLLSYPKAFFVSRRKGCASFQVSGDVDFDPLGCKTDGSWLVVKHYAAG